MATARGASLGRRPTLPEPQPVSVHSLPLADFGDLWTVAARHLACCGRNPLTVACVTPLSGLDARDSCTVPAVTSRRLKHARGGSVLRKHVAGHQPPRRQVGDFAGCDPVVLWLRTFATRWPGRDTGALSSRTRRLVARHQQRRQWPPAGAAGLRQCAARRGSGSYGRRARCSSPHAVAGEDLSPPLRIRSQTGLPTNNRRHRGCQRFKRGYIRQVSKRDGGAGSRSCWATWHMSYSASARGLQSFSRDNLGYLVVSSTSRPARYANQVSMFRLGTATRTLSSSVGTATPCCWHSRASWFWRFFVEPESASIITTRNVRWRLRIASNSVGKRSLTHCSPDPRSGQGKEATCLPRNLRWWRKRRAKASIWRSSHSKVIWITAFDPIRVRSAPMPTAHRWRLRVRRLLVQDPRRHDRTTWRSRWPSSRS